MSQGGTDMSWRLVLSDYPHAVLNDELGVVILAMVESGGLLDEEELAGNLKVDRALLVKTLVALHGDRLIEYARQRVRVSDRGKALLDRLTIGVAIVDGLIAKLDVQPTLKTQLRARIAQYRDQAFDSYVGSISATRSWSAFCGDDDFSPHLPPESEASGHLAIWLRDLELWAETQLQNSVTPSGGARTAFKAAAQYDKQSRLALRWLEALESVERAHDPWQKLSAQRDDLTSVFCLHQQSRARVDESVFADAWAPGGVWLVYLKTFSRLRDALQHVPAYAATHWPQVAAVVNTEQQDWPERVLRRQFNTLLINLMSAETFSDLAAVTALDESSLRVLLEQIRDRCQKFVSEANHSAPQGVDGSQGNEDVTSGQAVASKQRSRKRRRPTSR